MEAILVNMRSWCPVIVQLSSVSATTPASLGQKSASEQQTYKSHNCYNTTTRSLYYVQVEHTDTLHQ